MPEKAVVIGVTVVAVVVRVVAAVVVVEPKAAS